LRAYDLALMLALFGAVMGILDSSDLFTGSDIDTGGDVITKAELSDIQVVGADGTESDLGIIAKTAKWGFDGTMFLLRVMGRVVFIADIVAGVFGGTSDAWAVAWAVQIGIYMTYAIAMFQAWTKTSIRGMQ